MFSFTGGELPKDGIHLISLLYAEMMPKMREPVSLVVNNRAVHVSKWAHLKLAVDTRTLTSSTWKTQNQHHLLMKIYVSVNNPQVAKYLIEPRKKQLQAYYLPLYWLFFNVHRDPMKKWFIIIKKTNLNNQLFCSFAQLSSTIQSKSFTPSTAPPGRNLQLKGYRRTPTEFGFFFSGKS